MNKASPRDPAEGLILRLVRQQGTHTRASLGEATGWARSTVARRVDSLVESGLLDQGEAPSTGGRPPEQFSFNQYAGSFVVADLGITHSTLARVDLNGDPLSEPVDLELDLTAGPSPTLPVIREVIDDLIAASDLPPLLAVGVGLPAPIDANTQRPSDPPILSAWNGYPLAESIAPEVSVPTFVENDANLMAVGEYRRRWPQARSLVFVKVGTGIGAGIVVRDRLYRGAHGAAGDIGHIQLEAHADQLCQCGRNGCLEAIAGGGALAKRVSALGRRAENARAVASLVHSGDPEVKSLVRTAGTHIGSVLAGVVSFANPDVIVLGGDLGIEPLILSSVRAEVHSRPLALASRDLTVQSSQLGRTVGIIGAAELVLDRLWPAHDTGLLGRSARDGAGRARTPTPR
ncbi:MAG: ROK family transcriptional regulator [Nitriliruptorales bacterium]|nr:ROK family transcriptional regulator [Nitriliruptorales bacterium]